jgi:hypothetical protein
MIMWVDSGVREMKSQKLSCAEEEDGILLSGEPLKA